MAARAEKVTFVWQGMNKKGDRVTGETDALNENLAKAELRRQGINPTKVKKKPKPLFGSGKKITSKDISVFSRQLATMMSAGVPLVQAFEIIGKGHENPNMQNLLMDIKNSVESGDSLADSLAKHPKHFDDLYVNLVNSGEQAGALETLLDKIATYKEKTESMKAKIKKAITYPAAVVVIAFIVSTILLVKVVPTFQDLFQGFGADLPAFTQMVINLSEVFQKWWWAIFGVIGFTIFALIRAHKTSPKFRRSFDKLMLKFPIIGVIIEKSSIARFARTLSTMFAAGVPLVEAMGSVAGATGNAVFSDATLRMRDDVATGMQLQQTMKSTGVFPNMVTQMVAIGEESGSLDAMLSKVADFHEEEVDNMVDNLSSLLEPMIMAILGVLVGGLVIAMYLPIFKMGSVI
ncbi:MAG TPA: type II secretion system F family protein [Chromatiales bacterium]|nr:type II secretion system F family protein [Thiotrichales bacterium]HIP68731.1 type II secretion system F family protein [Chromatiales bacterium]